MKGESRKAKPIYPLGNKANLSFTAEHAWCAELYNDNNIILILGGLCDLRG